MSNGKQGRPPAPRSGSMARFLLDRPRDWPVYEFVRDHIAAEAGRWGSKERAIEAAQVKFCIKERRTVQLKCARMKPWDQAWQTCVTGEEWQRTASSGVNAQRIFDDLKLRISAAEFTPDDLEELQHVGVRLLSKIADDRIELKKLRAEVSGRKGKNLR